jgi:heme exporter protein A
MPVALNLDTGYDLRHLFKRFHVMLQVNSLSFDYQDKPLLHRIRFSLGAGSILHLRGENGSGKTTLLRLLAGLIRPLKGSIVWEGQSIHEDLPSYQRNLCFVGHRSGLSPQLTVQESCYYDWHWPRKQNSLPELLSQFSLKELADTPCYQLSAGQQRRVALLRLVMTDARLWLLDEPLVALDKNSMASLMTCLQAHLKQGGLIIMTSHQDLPGELRHYEEYTL